MKPSLFTVNYRVTPLGWRPNNAIYIVGLMSLSVLAGGMTVIASNPLLGAGIGVAIPVACICWLNPRITLTLLVIAVSLIYWFTTDLKLLPDSAKFVKEALILLLFSRALFTAVREQSFVRTPIDKWLILFVCLALLSGLANQVSLEVVLAALRGLFQYGLVFYSIIWLRNYFNRHFMQRLIGLGIGLAIFQFPVGLWQMWLGWNYSLFGQDTFRGTIGASGANNVGIFILPCLFYVMARMIDRREWDLKQVVMLLVLMVIPVLSFSRMAWLCFAIGFGILWKVKVFQQRRLLLLTVILGVISGLMLVLSVQLVATAEETQGSGRSLTIDRLINPEGVIRSFTTPGYGIGLTAWGEVAYRTVMREAPIPILGLGPGSGGSSAAVHLNTVPYYRFFYDFFDQKRHGLVHHVPAQVLQTIIEYGPFGMVMLFLICREFYRMAQRARQMREDRFLTALAAAQIVQVVIMVLLSFKDGIWEQQMIAMWMWVLGGLLFILSKLENNSHAIKK